ncbi:hypothetical protein RirG_126880 [Rhizophagus irregularis DAOM 197198w]|uniref:Uncharacterized protein n=1 Tax=Rhizophagus irregularis (strain DAOM 197198w) TaxID=1432141 RepID=A0A015MGY4_RHIIW|nr:hypothetical protein RirG_126880 [Rhizophagus irregularis DAOM 197198w]
MKLVNKEISSECNIAVTSSKEIKRIELSEALAASATTGKKMVYPTHILHISYIYRVLKM